MSLIRPELAARLAPWREVMAAGVLAVLGAWVFLLGGWVYRPVGVALIALAATWGLGSWRRMRFTRGVEAPGLVEVIEGAIRLYGARALGGEVALRDLTEIRLLRLNGRVHWRLRSASGEALLIPVEAAGSGQLADAFSALPGFDLGAAAAALDGQAAVTTVWKRK